MYQARNATEEGWIARIAHGCLAARRSYAEWLCGRGESSRAAFLRLDQAALYAPWLASLNGEWLDTLGIEWLRALGHEALAFSTRCAVVAPLQTAQLTSRAAYKPFWPQHLLIAAAGTPRGAADWAVNDLRIGNFSQFCKSGDLTGNIFATSEIGRYTAFKEQRIELGTEVKLIVTYIGAEEQGVPFHGWLVGSLEP